MISVVVPIYNTEALLPRCIESILNQSYVDTEVILVDDGSRDNSLAVCREYARRDGRIMVIAKQNGGVSTARNAGLEVATGEWIMFVDPDDYLEKDIVEILLSHSGNADIVACCCIGEWQLNSGNRRTRTSFFEGNSVFSENKTVYLGGYTPRDKKELLYELMDKNYGSSVERVTAIGVPWGKLYRMSFLKKQQLHFDMKLFRMQDNIFNMYAFEAANYVLYVDSPGYIYNVGHIRRFGRQFDQRAKEYFKRVIEIRDCYCRDKALLNDPEIRALKATEIIKLSNMILTMDFLHLKNKDRLSKKVQEIREFFSDQIFKEAFKEKNVGYASASHRVRILLLKWGMIHSLIWLDYSIQYMEQRRASK